MKRPTQLLDWLQRAANHDSAFTLTPVRTRELLAYVAELERPPPTLGVDLAEGQDRTIWVERKADWLARQPKPRYVVYPIPPGFSGYSVYDHERAEPVSVAMTLREARDHATYLNASDALAKANAADDKREQRRAAFGDVRSAFHPKK